MLKNLFNIVILILNHIAVCHSQSTAREEAGRSTGNPNKAGARKVRCCVNQEEAARTAGDQTVEAAGRWPNEAAARSAANPSTSNSIKIAVRKSQHQTCLQAQLSIAKFAMTTANSECHTCDWERAQSPGEAPIYTLVPRGGAFWYVGGNHMIQSRGTYAWIGVSFSCLSFRKFSRWIYSYSQTYLLLLRSVIPRSKSLKFSLITILWQRHLFLVNKILFSVKINLLSGIWTRKT